MDGGSTHDIVISAEKPDDARKVRIDLAYGQTSGYIQGETIIIVNPTTTLEERKYPRLVSLGKLIAELDLVLKWDSK